MLFSDKDILVLTSLVSERLSEKRFSHTVGVMNMAEKLSDCYLPEQKDLAKVSALLHDISKELSREENMAIISKENILLSEYDLKTEGVIHSYTAPFVIKREFPYFAKDEVLSATYKHTVGDESMSVLDEIIFLSDFIEEGRTNKTSAELREWVLSHLYTEDGKPDFNTLHRACIAEIDSTIEYLNSKKSEINPKTLLTRKRLLSKIIDA